MFNWWVLFKMDGHEFNKCYDRKVEIVDSKVI